MAWYTCLASAEAYWNGGSTSRAVFDVAFDRRFVGAAGVAQAIQHLDRGRADPAGNGLAMAREMLDAAEGQATPAGRRTVPVQGYIAHLRLAADLAAWQARARRVLTELIPSAGRIARGQPTREARWARQEIEALLAEAEEWRERAEAVLAQSLLPAEAVEAIETQTAGWKEALEG
jgi:hypothetical protein